MEGRRHHNATAQPLMGAHPSHTGNAVCGAPPGVHYSHDPLFDRGERPVAMESCDGNAAMEKSPVGPNANPKRMSISNGSRATTWRLRIKVEQRNVLVINTKAWYHQTHIEVQPREDGLSCSFARDWYI